jgi:hypothetical protein
MHHLIQPLLWIHDTYPMWVGWLFQRARDVTESR